MLEQEKQLAGRAFITLSGLSICCPALTGEKWFGREYTSRLKQNEAARYKNEEIK